MNARYVKPLILCSVGAGSGVALLAVMLFVLRGVSDSPLCPDGIRPGLPLSCVLGVLLSRLAAIAGISLLIFYFFRKYFKYSVLISFFALCYAWELRTVIKWLFTPLQLLQGEWLFYILMLPLGALLFFLFYLYFVKLKMWLWLKLLLAVALLFILPLILLNIERHLYAAFY